MSRSSSTLAAPARRIDLRASPEELLLAWPPHRPLAALWSGAAGGEPSPWSRWTVFAEPARTVIARRGDDVLRMLAAGWDQTVLPPREAPADAPPFTSGWIGFLSYQLGRELEPKAGASNQPPDPDPWPLAVWHRCEAALAFDSHRGQWWLTGDAARAQSWLDAALSNLPCQPRSFELGHLESRTGRDAYIAAAVRAIEYIHAGDIFQANLAHRLSAPFHGSTRALFARLAALAQPWFGAYIECPPLPPPASACRRAIASISPELFLHVDPQSRRVVTRPMKGTRRAASPGDLATNPKDIAELSMIIDLMRSDIGRVCELASVRVDEARALEHHAHAADSPVAAGATEAAAGVLQGVATVSGVLRRDASLLDLLAATFPGGSVTGAPKIRAMQIIEELEPLARGPYCGSIGYVSDTGHAAFNIAIRTALISAGSEATSPLPMQRTGGGNALPTSPLDEFLPGSTLDYPVGAGIVADSRPPAEWDETLDKASTIRSLCAGS